MKTIVVVAIILMMMVGSANALSVKIDGANPVVLTPGTETKLGVTVSDLAVPPKLPHQIKLTEITVTCHPDTPCKATDLEAEILVPSFSAETDPFTQSNAIKLELDEEATQGTKYIVHLKSGDVTAKELTVEADKTVMSVPEFPSLAVPVAGVLGLMFLLQRKKR